MEASGTIVPDEPTQGLEISRPMKPVMKHSAPAVLKSQKSNADSESFILDDFQRPPGVSHERSYPISAGKLLEESFIYHTSSLPDAQHIFHLISLLKRFLPNSAALSSHERELMGTQRLAETRQILQDYAQYCKIELGLSTEEIYTILSDHLAHLARFRIHPLQAEAIFAAYQEQLEKCMLFTPSTVLRNLLYPSYGAFREHLLENSGIGLMCLQCNKPINAATRKCENCGERLDPCPICLSKYSPFTVTKRAKKMEDLKIPAIRIAPDGALENLLIPDTDLRPSPKLTLDEPTTQRSHPVLYQFCLSCGHGAHAACLQHQQKIPELGGRCPVAGCGCACIPGVYRDRVIKEMEGETARKAAGVVKGDGRRVRESGAVKGVRGLLGEEQAKKVRVVVPEK